MFYNSRKNSTMNIDRFVEEFTNLWNNSSISFPNLGEEIPIDEKIRREVGVEDFSRSAKKDVDYKNFQGSGKKKLTLQFKQNMAVFFKNTFNYESDELAILSGRGFTSVTREFMKMARNFDPSVKMEDIFQASRNLWIINSLQLLMNEPVKVSPSTFAYSMLYPYTDNYLDNPSVTRSEKISFSARFALRLKGEKVLAGNNYEQKIFDLVEMVENDWERDMYPQVYESLIAIHNAQTRSIFLVNKKGSLSDRELLSICIEKGGTSVLADGYLIKGNMTPEQEWFCFGFGTFLQFIDDIQDIKEDYDGNLETLFTRGSMTNRLEEFTNRTMSFSDAVLKDLKYCFISDDLDAVQRLMIKSVTTMVNEAVGLNDNFYQKQYVTSFERYSPFRYSFLKKRRNNIDPNRISLMKKIESFVFEEEQVALEVL
jgi:hypothetical protein